MSENCLGHNVIEILDVTKTYKLYETPKERLKEALFPFLGQKHEKYHALKDVNLTFEKGQTIGLVGKNGAGKSTLLKIITGIVTPTKGQVKVVGKIASLLELGAGFNIELTGLDNIYLNGSLMGFSHDEMSKKVDKILSFAEIGEFIHQPVKMYSSGMFARLAFSVAINVEPDILIIDEALSVGDLRFQLKCMDKFNEFRRSGKTIIFVSHDINAIKRFCTYTVWINQGKVEVAGHTDIVTDQYLDFLKLADKKESGNNINNTGIACIDSVRLISGGKDIQEITFGSEVEVEVIYSVYDIHILNPVLGVSINTLDSQNICGLNTLLDRVDIPWVKGKNKFRVKYRNMNLISGTYSLDVALFEENATVPFDYKADSKRLLIKSSYIGEGVCVLDHEWSE